ncbi:hypothetical protein PUN28_013442 [Cardiocondyla obscurior]|uniref:Uncharacterized protein n=1 Tax=Cardiocondyla obscurior TaxID=286306 RepID=A0AAW2F2V3_9HYME
MMDRRLSNVQLQQQFYEEQRYRHRHSNTGSGGSGGSGVSSPRRSIDRNGQEYRRSILQQPRSSVGARSSNGVGGAYENRATVNNDRYAGYYLGYVGQTAHKRRRTTFWETLTGLVCSLGALASRAAKMAARRGDPL